MLLSPGRGRPAKVPLAVAAVLAVAGCSGHGDDGLGVAKALPTTPAARLVAPPTVTATPTPEPTRPSPAPTQNGSKDGPPRPVMGGNFADPDVLEDGGAYYAYATNSRNQNIPLATAPSIRGPWTRQPEDALPRLGGWAKTGNTWAPEVVRRPDGTFVLYYTAASRYHRTQCIGVATARSPRGPFRPVGSRPLVCRDGEFIDPAFFRDRDGKAYLLYRGHRGAGPTSIYMRRLGKHWLGFSSAPTRILTWDRRRDPHLVEAPALVRRGGRYVLFYSSGLFYEDSYRTRYALSKKITGPYRPASGPLLSTRKYRRELVGPGGADIVHGRDRDYIVFHGITSFGGGRSVVRGMYVAELNWADDRPVVSDIS